MKNLAHWIKNNYPEFIVILLIISVTLFLRFYRLDEYMTFLGDEGRDAIEVKEILTEGDFPLLGPTTSVGNMYLGPLYYYMMAIPMFVFWLNPVSAAGMVALLGTLSVGLIYYLGRVWFGKLPAAIAAVLYTVSPVTITYSKSSWNPNPTPFFALLIVLGLYKAHQTKNYVWFILVGIATAFIIQMHYLALIILPIIAVLFFYEFVYRNKGKNFWKGTILGIVCFLFLMSPLLIFDLKYNFQNFNAFKKFFTERETTVNLNAANALERAVPIYQQNLVSRYIAGRNEVLSYLVSILIFIPIVYAFLKRKFIWEVIALNLWLIIGIVGLMLYKQTIYDHYLGFINPAPYLLLAALIFIINNTVKNNQIIKLCIIIFVAILAFLNLKLNPLNLSPNNQLARTQKIAKFIISETDKKPYNFALIAEHNYDAAYKFYLELYGNKPKKLPFEKTEILMVVCEDKICNPVGHPKQEIADFGWSKIIEEFNIDGIKIYKLVKNTSQSASK